MTGFIGGLAAATFWASAGLCSARSSRLLGVFAAFAVTNLIGLVFIASVAIVVAGPPSAVSTHDLTLALISGGATTIALASIFRAFRGTKIGLASAIVSADGALAAGAAFLLFGERVTLLALVALGIITVGVAMVALRPGEGGRIDRATLGFALLGGVGFASALVASSRADGLDPLWVVATGRVIGFLAVTVPFLLLRGGFRLPRVILPFVILSPVFDTLGFLSYVVASGDGVAVPAVLSGLATPLGALFAFLFLKERLERHQVVAIGVVVVGLALLGVARAA